MLAPELNDRLILPYGTLLYRETVDDLMQHNSDLCRVALDLRDRDPGASKSNEGGWHSQGNVFEHSSPALGALAMNLRKVIRYLCSVSLQSPSGKPLELSASLYGWFNVNEHGDYNLPHHHSGNTWSGVYYVRTGAPASDHPMSGAIEFLDPRVRCDVAPKRGFSHTGALSIKPHPGLLLVFPSYLEHFVHPYRGKGQRVTLAFNSLVQSGTKD